MGKAKDSDTPSQRFARLVGKVVSVPKTEIERREAEWKKQKQQKEKT